jgi:sterol desaturase/sphingolipid hydroxylase (fatty acid hydroxylase superfamily)
MNATRFLKMAAVLMLLLAVGHSLGYPWVGNLTDDQFKALAGAAKSASAPIQGFERSYWDFHVGFGWMLSLVFLAQAVVVWCLAPLAAAQPRQVRIVVAVFAAQFLAMLVLDLYYFFWAPIVFCAAIALCLIAAAFSAERSAGNRAA